MEFGYPRELNLDEDTERRLVSYLNQELINHYHEREPYLANLKKWQEQYWAEPSQERLTFPFDGAANIVIPITAISVEAIHARNIMQLEALPRMVEATVVNPSWDDSVRNIESHLDFELRRNVRFLEKTESSILECEKFGTGIGKSSYEKLIKTAVKEMPDGSEQEFFVTIKDGASVDSVSFARFLLPFYARDPQTSPWVGEEHNETPFSVKVLEESGFFKPGTFARLREWVSRSPVGTFGQERKFERRQEELEKRAVTWPQYIDWQEIWLGFDIDSAPTEYEHQSGYQTNLTNYGTPKELVVHFHRASMTIMSARYNWYSDLHRPYRVSKYFPVEHRWTGIGICKQNEQFQDEITTQHRTRLDNATMANMRMIKINKLSGYGPSEPIFPGKMWFLDDMDHVDSLQMSEIYPSGYNNEQATLIYSQQRTGVNEVTLGMPQVGTPGTATGDVARIQEGGKKFDYTYRNIRKYLSELVLDVACTIQQFGPKNLLYYSNAEDGEMVRKFFEMPPALIRDSLLIEFGISNQKQNLIIDRQDWMQVSQMLTQYFSGLMQLAQATQNTQLMQMIAAHGMYGATEAMRQILESFPNIRNIDRILVRELLNTVKDNIDATTKPNTPTAGLLGSGTNGAGSQGNPLSIVSQRVADLSKTLQGSGGGRPS